MSAEIPHWLSSSLTQADANRIEDAVKRAELVTSAEIVPMIVHRSTLKATGDRIVFWISFALFGVGGAASLSLFGGLDEALLDRVIGAMGLWPSSETHLILSIVAEVIVATLAFAVSWLVAKYASRSDAIHRRVFPASDLALEAEHRAQHEFFSSDLRATAGQTGVLLMVSMLEHRAVILADEKVVAKFKPEAWTKTLNDLLGSIREGKMADGYVNAVVSLGDELSKHFPAKKNEHDELSNRLRIIE